ncbi:unnamed protein product [Phytophthora lilii]|uniref:Unnamed protein product n=1 Tax=Phytophthora lilii TaxID=2077276 RepID=A0A9W6XIB4_9STRA|nr:unnamed protein product [Phytophthora lilii]
MVTITEDHGSMTLLEAKVMLRREYDTIHKREKQENVSNVSTGELRRHGSGRQRRRDSQDDRQGRGSHKQRWHGRQYDRVVPKDTAVMRVQPSSTEACTVNSGAGSEMTNERSDFSEVSATGSSGHYLPVRGVGTVRVSSSDGKGIKMLYVPTLDRKLLSIPALTAKVRFDGDGCVIEYKGSVVSQVRKTGTNSRTSRYIAKCMLMRLQK